MKCGASSYSYLRLLESGQMDLPAVIDKTAEMGFDGIEFAMLYGYDTADPDILSHVRKLRQACADASLPIISYTIGADFLARDWRQEAERLKGEVRIAAELGVPVMRHDATCGFPEGHQGDASFDAALPALADGCRAVTEYAATLGVKTTVENHGFFVQDSDRCEKLMKAVDHENFGALVDVGNFLCADEEPTLAVARMAPYALHCHVKDFHVKPADAADPGKGWFRSRGGNYLRGSILGHGNVDVPTCLATLKRAGYDGFVSIEFEGLEDNLQALEIGLENLRKYMAGS